MPEEQNEDPTLRQLVDALCVFHLEHKTERQRKFCDQAERVIYKHARRLQLEAELSELDAGEQPKKA